MHAPCESASDRAGLRDAAGRLVLEFTPAETFGDPTPRAESAAIPSGADPLAAASAIVTQLPGWRLSTADEELAEALTALGATVTRHSHLLVRLLDGSDTCPANSGAARVHALSPAQLDRHALALAGVRLRAYPASHPDSDGADPAATASLLRAIARGEVLGPMVAESRVAVAAGRIVGACLVVDPVGTAPGGQGAWILDLFRDPDAPARTGAALLAHALAALHGSAVPAASLLVTHDNRSARRLYERCGFEPEAQRWTLAIPQQPALSPSG